MPELIFIGTSSGKTDIQRFHSSFFLKTEKYGFLIDAGDGISKALINAGIRFDEIDGVVITHTHADHLAGIASLVTQMVIEGREKEFTVFIFSSYEKRLMDCLNLSLLFPERFSFKLQIRGFDFEKEVAVSSSLSFITRQNSHVQKKEGITTDFPFASASLAVKAGNSRLVYTSDVGSAEDLSLFDDLNYEIFISECEHIAPEDLIAFSKDRKDVSFYAIHYTDEEKIENVFYHSSVTITKEKMRIGLN